MTKLERFLDKEGLLQLFTKRYVDGENPLTADRFFKEYGNSIRAFDCAFMWKHAAEGQEYWERVRDKYNESFYTKLEAFLIKHDLLERFKNNLDTTYTWDEYNNAFGNADYAISQAFVWRGTGEGRAFWHLADALYEETFK